MGSPNSLAVSSQRISAALALASASSCVATYLAERTWHPSQECRFRKDGSLELCFRSSGGIEIEKFVLSRQPHIRVVAPARLREKVVEALRSGIERNVSTRSHS